jgi:sulfatase maturation enzyme AslB (radical SAM superfamily)
MNEQPKDIRAEYAPIDPAKFIDPLTTAKGETRAQVKLEKLQTLWINTGTLCNITCTNCYIDSSPTNDQLVYFSTSDAITLYEEINDLGLQTGEIGFTGGEPFMNPQLLEMVKQALSRGFRVLILTNAMQPMQRKKTKQGLLDLREKYGDRLTLRVSLDHYSQELHEIERGTQSWDKVIEGLDWLNENNFSIAIAGRTCWGEPDASERQGYARLISSHGWAIDPQNFAQLVLFPEMDEKVDVPEITTACWGILGKAPQDVMCATSRMVVKRKAAPTPIILPCTLLPYDSNFEMGQKLSEALTINGGNFHNGAVKLNHPHCAKFCVLGGGSCTA